MGAERGNMAILDLCNVFEYKGAYRLKSENCEKKTIKLKSQYLYVCLIYRKPWLKFKVLLDMSQNKGLQLYQTQNTLLSNSYFYA